MKIKCSLWLQKNNMIEKMDTIREQYDKKQLII